MGLLGVPYVVVAPDVAEDTDGDVCPRDAVLRLAREKAEAVAGRFPGRIVIAADTVVDFEGAILGKPSGPEDARHMLELLRGRWHRVWTGLVVCFGAGEMTAAAESTDVLMRQYGDDEAAAYLATGDPLDKAAAYAIQDGLFRPVASISGCYANVMGLPICRLHQLLSSAGATGLCSPVGRCTAHLGISCRGQTDPSPGSDKEV